MQKKHRDQFFFFFFLASQLGFTVFHYISTAENAGQHRLLGAVNITGVPQIAFQKD